MRTKIYFFRKTTPRGTPGEPPPKFDPYAHTRNGTPEVIFGHFLALKAGFYAAKADCRCSKWPYTVILKPYGKISHTYTIQDIQTACLNLFLKRFEDFSKLKMRQIDKKWVTQSQTGPYAIYGICNYTDKPVAWYEYDNTFLARAPAATYQWVPMVLACVGVPKRQNFPAALAYG